MSMWNLPTSLSVGGVGYFIRTDFRVILDILDAYNDPDNDPEERSLICLWSLYQDAESIPPEHYQEALEKAVEFIDAGFAPDSSNNSRPTLMDWEQDAPLIIPAVNRVAGREIRSMEYLHWWTFLGYYMEIGESLFTQVISIREKKAKGKKLEKYEREFYNENKRIITLKHKESQREKEEKDAVRELFGYKKR